MPRRALAAKLTPSPAAALGKAMSPYSPSPVGTPLLFTGSPNTCADAPVAAPRLRTSVVAIATWVVLIGSSLESATSLVARRAGSHHKTSARSPRGGRAQAVAGGDGSADEREAERDAFDVADAAAHPEVDGIAKADVDAEPEGEFEIAVAAAERGDHHGLHVGHEARLRSLEQEPPSE